jgi:hypothetical protein
MVIEPPVVLKKRVKGFLAGMAEGRMAEIVGKGDGFTEVFIEPQSPGEGPGVLGYFQRVGQARPVKISFVDQKNLCFVLKILKYLRVKNPVPVPLKTGAIVVGLVAVQRSANAVRAFCGVGG